MMSIHYVIQYTVNTYSSPWSLLTLSRSLNQNTEYLKSCHVTYTVYGQ